MKNEAAVYLKYKAYLDQVTDYLEYLGYLDYVLQFEPECVAKAIVHTAAIFFAEDLSFRFCALAIFGLTWENQISRTDGITVN